MLAAPPETHTSVAARLDRLPLCGFHRRFITLIALGAWFDLYDLFMMAYLGAALQASHFLTLTQFTEVIASSFGGMFVGTLVLGLASDRYGRRVSFLFMLAIYSVFTLGGALSTTPHVLMAMRFLAGIGVGAELVVIDTYVAEVVPRHARGRYLAIAHLIGFSAVPAAALLSAALVPTHWVLDGWRWVMIIGSAGALIAWYLRRNLPESPRWYESAGRGEEAEQVMLAIEAKVRRETGDDLPPVLAPPLISRPATVFQPASVAELFRRPYLGRTCMLAVFHLLQTVGVYGFANWAPTFLLRQGRDLSHSLAYGALMASVSPLGPAIAVLTSERLERKWTTAILALSMAACGMCFPFASGGAAIVGVGAAMTVLSYWFSTVYHTYQAELFPTRLRATGVGFTYSCSRLSAVLSTIVIGALLARGPFLVFVFMAAAMIGVAAVVAAFGPRTNLRALEEVSA